MKSSKNSVLAPCRAGNASASVYTYVNYDNNGHNTPPVNENRVLVIPEVYNQRGQFITENQVINIGSIGAKGLEIRLPYDKSDHKHTVGQNDVIQITAYISKCKDMASPKRLPIINLPEVTLKKGDLDKGYYQAIIDPKLLIGYTSLDGVSIGSITIEYSRLAGRETSKTYTRSFNTYGPHFVDI